MFCGHIWIEFICSQFNLIQFNILPIFNRLRAIRLFHFGWDFPIVDEICGVFEETYHHNFEKHFLRKHFLASNRFIWAIVRRNRFHTCWGCWSAGRTHPCKIWIIHNFDFGEWLQFTISSLHRPSTSTRQSPAWHVMRTWIKSLGNRR